MMVMVRIKQGKDWGHSGGLLLSTLSAETNRKERHSYRVADRNTMT